MTRDLSKLTTEERRALGRSQIASAFGAMLRALADDCARSADEAGGISTALMQMAAEIHTMATREHFIDPLLTVQIYRECQLLHAPGQTTINAAAFVAMQRRIAEAINPTESPMTMSVTEGTQARVMFQLGTEAIDARVPAALVVVPVGTRARCYHGGTDDYVAMLLGTAFNAVRRLNGDHVARRAIDYARAEREARGE
jgi:hypothetical protein